MDDLIATVSMFIRSVSQHAPDIKEIRISPADASYSSQEIDQCVNEILASPQNAYTREQIASKYKGFEVFDLYEKLFGKGFLPKHYNSKSRASARSRLFKAIAKKHLPEWEAVTEYSIGNDSVLARRE